MIKGSYGVAKLVVTYSFFSSGPTSNRINPLGSIEDIRVDQVFKENQKLNTVTEEIDQRKNPCDEIPSNAG